MAANQLQQAERERRLECEPRALLFRLLAEIAMQRALKEGGALGHLRHLVVDDQGGRSIHPLHGFHRVGAEVGRPPCPAIAFPAGLRAVDAPPVRQSFGLQRVLPQRQIDRQRIVRRHRRQREARAEIRVLDRLAAAHGKTRQHGEPLDVQQAVAGDVGARLEPHVADVLGEATRDLGGAQSAVAATAVRVQSCARLLRSGWRGCSTMTTSAKSCGSFALPTVQAFSGIRQMPAHPGIHEIGAALEIDRAPLEIVRYRGLAVGRRSFGEPREDFAVVVAGAQQHVVAGSVATGRGRARDRGRPPRSR